MKNSTFALLAALAALATAMVCLAGVMLVTRIDAVQTPTLGVGDTVFAQKGQGLWYAPGGDDPPKGYLAKKLATLEGGEKMIITANMHGGAIIPVFGSGTWYRVVIIHSFTPPLEGTYRQTGWVRLP